MPTKSMAAVVETRLKDWLQHLVHRLLNQAVDDIRDAEAALASAGFGDPNPPNISRAILPRQQRMSQPGQQPMALAYDLHHAASINAMCALVARDSP
jgi:hypothetical protein